MGLKIIQEPIEKSAQEIKPPNTTISHMQHIASSIGGFSLEAKEFVPTEKPPQFEKSGVTIGDISLPQQQRIASLVRLVSKRL